MGLNTPNKIMNGALGSFLSKKICIKYWLIYMSDDRLQCKSYNICYISRIRKVKWGTPRERIAVWKWFLACMFPAGSRKC